MPLQKHYFTIKKKQKVALFLHNELSLTHRYIQKLFDTNCIFINDKICKDKTLFYKGVIAVLLFVAKTKNLKPIFLTNDLLFFDKPPGLYIHPQITYNDYTLLDEIRHFGSKDANPCHRLDRETSGLVVAGRDRTSTIQIKNLFEQREIKKEYLAVVKGKITYHFTINEPLSRTYNFDTSKHKVKVCQNGKPSVTHVIPLHYYKNNHQTLVKLIPLTGRTHQLRVHMFHVKHPIIGDPIYGADYKFADDYLNKKITQLDRIKYLGSKRLMLHNYKLEFDYMSRFTIISQCSTWNTTLV